MSGRPLGAVFVLWSAALVAAAQAPEGLPHPGENLASKVQRQQTNAAADELSGKVVGLGLDLDPKNPNVEHPGRADQDAVASASAWAWMDGQLATGDDSIAAEPQALRRFLQERSVAFWQVVAVLEKATPEWAPREFSEVPARFLALMRLDRLLLAAALSEERSGAGAEPRRLLEASWSIFRSLDRDPETVSAILATAVMKMQVGVLRKLRDPPVEWLDRLSGDNPWRRCLDAFENEPRAIAASDPSLAVDALSGSYANVSVRAHRAAAEWLRHVTPCELGSLSDEDIVRPMAEEYRKLNDPGVDSAEIGRILSEMALPELRKSLVRSGRLAVDAELTRKILELRFARAASRDRRWPATLDESSRVCPDAGYSYQRAGPAMQIDFTGSLPEAEYGLKLPLSFSARADRRPAPATAVPTAAPPLLPEPESN